MNTYENYEKIRNARNLKNSDVSKMTGIPKSTFSEWKNGKFDLKIDKLCKIAIVLDCSVDDLIGEQEKTTLDVPEVPNEFVSREIAELTNIYLHLSEENQAFLLLTARHLLKESI